MDETRVGIATDHGGFGLKEKLVAHLQEAGDEVVDYGAHALNEGDDYSDFVTPIAGIWLRAKSTAGSRSAAAAVALIKHPEN